MFTINLDTPDHTGNAWDKLIAFVQGRSINESGSICPSHCPNMPDWTILVSGWNGPQGAAIVEMFQMLQKLLWKRPHSHELFYYENTHLQVISYIVYWFAPTSNMYYTLQLVSDGRLGGGALVTTCFTFHLVKWNKNQESETIEKTHEVTSYKISVFTTVFSCVFC